MTLVQDLGLDHRFCTLELTQYSSLYRDLSEGSAPFVFVAFLICLLNPSIELVTLHDF